MGYYINPPTMSKEAFLQQNGKEFSDLNILEALDFKGSMLPVCLVDNIIFTAAAIAYSKEEADHFSEEDGRSKKWYLVSKEDLSPYYKER